MLIQRYTSVCIKRKSTLALRPGCDLHTLKEACTERHPPSRVHSTPVFRDWEADVGLATPRGRSGAAAEYPVVAQEQQEVEAPPAESQPVLEGQSVRRWVSEAAQSAHSSAGWLSLLRSRSRRQLVREYPSGQQSVQE